MLEQELKMSGALFGLAGGCLWQFVLAATDQNCGAVIAMQR